MGAENAPDQLTRDALQTKGRSAVAAILDEEDPPELIEFGSMGGPHHLRAQALSVQAVAETEETDTVSPVEGDIDTGTATARVIKDLDSIWLHLRWVRLSDRDMWMIEVRDDDGNMIDSGVGDNVDDAILGIIERLLPP